MEPEPITTYHCPQCGVLLESTGAITVDGADCPLFQCDACVVTKPIFGEPFEVALTFAVNSAGQPFDPVDDRLLS
jgi:hypothetical protein